MANVAFSKSSEELRQWKTVNFPARKLGNFLWPVKTLEKRWENVGANDNSKTKFFRKTQTSGRTTFFLALKNWQTKRAIKTLTQMIYVQFYCLSERSEVWKLVTIDKSAAVPDDGYS